MIYIIHNIIYIEREREKEREKLNKRRQKEEETGEQLHGDWLQ